MNFRRIMLALLTATAVALVASWQAPAAQAQAPVYGSGNGSAGNWPPYPGYPAYGGWYHYGHQHHYVYRAHNWQWHPAGWGFLGPYGGWYGGGLPWYGPGNCGVGGCGGGSLYYEGAGSPTSQGSLHDEPTPDGDDTEDFPGLPELP